MTPPSKLLLILEASRSMMEYAQSILIGTSLQFLSTPGDGHPVIILPGLGASDESTHYIRNFLIGLGYNVYPWGLGVNLGPLDGIDKTTSVVSDRIKQISAENNGAKVSIIGWSLGGIYAREIAKALPHIVRQVITLGTPFKGGKGSTNIAELYELLSSDKSHLDPATIETIATKPNVPFTSIYSKTDGVVTWKCCIEDESDISQNIEIPAASHLGLIHNPLCMRIISDRLAQPPNNWQRYNE